MREFCQRQGWVAGHGYRQRGPNKLMAVDEKINMQVLSQLNRDNMKVMDKFRRYPNGRPIHYLPGSTTDRKW